jgi:hypothetical protein
MHELLTREVEAVRIAMNATDRRCTVHVPQPLFRTLLLAAALTPGILATAARAQVSQARPGQPEQSLEARTKAFLEAISWADRERIVTFFPAAGDFEYQHTTHTDKGRTIGRWRFPAGTVGVSTPGSLWEALTNRQEEQVVGLFAAQVIMRGTEWPRVGTTRFVPPGFDRSSHTFVEWRLEGDRWVISRLGDESFTMEELPDWFFPVWPDRVATGETHCDLVKEFRESGVAPDEYAAITEKCLAYRRRCSSMGKAPGLQCNAAIAARMRSSRRNPE